MAARVVALLLAALATVGCVERVSQRQASSPDEGIQATGRIGGAQVAISHGDPRVFVADCDTPTTGRVDLCVQTRTIDGVAVGLVVANPAVLREPGRIEVRADRCADEACDVITEHAVVDLAFGGDLRRPVIRGSIEVADSADDRLVARFDLRLRDNGRLTGTLDVPLQSPLPAG